ncbi:MAG: carboxypeptidase regulatory-like domain-containing protein [Planctomycetes bacterium]|nr:carboxypeptidase regulatory-like domain-containing protein [Planctomycetota bacterium]
MSPRFLASILSLAALASAANAGVVSGRILDNLGNPVANATFEVDLMSGGGTPFVNGGFTDANGFFTATISPDDTYKITVLPPPAPGSLVAVSRIENVVVSTTPNNLGTVVMQLGTLLTGRIVASNGVPIVGAHLEFELSGQPVDFSNGDTNGAGEFTVAVPYGQRSLYIEPGPPPYYGGWTAAPRSLSMDISGPTDLGDIVLPPGVSVWARTVEASTGLSMNGVAFTAFDSATGAQWYTPDNKTDNAGNVLLTLPLGTFDLRFTPNVGGGASSLVAHELRQVAITSALNLGTVQIVEGVQLKGRVSDGNDDPVAGVQVEVIDPATNARVYVLDATTKANGSYKTYVPPGVYDVRFNPPFSVASGVELHTNIDLNDDATVDGSLPDLAFFSTVGAGSAGLGGITPVISASGGTPRLGNSNYTLEFSQTRGGAKGIVFYSIGSASGPLPSPLQVVPPMSRRIVQLAGSVGVAGDGHGSLALPIDNNPLLAGQMLRSWLLVRDGAASNGLASTNELRVILAP